MTFIVRALLAGGAVFLVTKLRRSRPPASFRTITPAERFEVARGASRAQLIQLLRSERAMMSAPV